MSSSPFQMTPNSRVRDGMNQYMELKVGKKNVAESPTVAIEEKSFHGIEEILEIAW